MDEEERPLLLALADVGADDIDSVWDLLPPEKFVTSSIVSILVQHLRLDYSDVVREGIARALELPAAYAYLACFPHEGFACG